MKLSRSLLYMLHYARSLHRQPLKIINWPGIERERERQMEDSFSTMLLGKRALPAIVCGSPTFSDLPSFLPGPNRMAIGGIRQLA